jgi:ribosome-binding factor A
MCREPVKSKAGRTLRVGDQIQRELSDLIHREVRDPRVGMVTLTGVKVSSDYAHASVRFTCLDPAQVADAAKGLQAASGYLRSQLAKRLNTYTTPELRFFYDESIERGDRLSRLIESVRTEPRS